MSAEAIVEAVRALNGRTLRRARRLCVAVQLLRSGHSRGEASKMLQIRFGIGQPEAWKLVDIAFNEFDTSAKGRA